MRPRDGNWHSVAVPVQRRRSALVAVSPSCVLVVRKRVVFILSDYCSAEQTRPLHNKPATVSPRPPRPPRPSTSVCSITSSIHSCTSSWAPEFSPCCSLSTARSCLHLPRHAFHSSTSLFSVRQSCLRSHSSAPPHPLPQMFGCIPSDFF